MKREAQLAPKLAALAGAVIFASFIFAGWSFYQGHTAACESRDKVLDVVSGLLMDSQPTPAEWAKMTPGRQERATRFYHAEYARVAAARC